MSQAGINLPDETHRLRCGGCGNLTRFDLTRTRRTTEFWHFDMAGEHQVESTDLLSETVESIRCRWCGREDAIEQIDRASADTASDPTTGNSSAGNPTPTGS